MASSLAACQTSRKSTLSRTIEEVKEYRLRIPFLYATARGEKTPTSRGELYVIVEGDREG
jgi:hypothetical protein